MFSLSPRPGSGGCFWSEAVFGATHKHGHTIDYILIRKGDDIVHQLQILPRAISDHHAISCILSCDTQSEKANPKSRRMFRRFDPIAFAEDLETSLNQTNKDSFSLCMEDVAHCINTCLDIHAPIRPNKATRRTHHPWYNDTIHAERIIRRRLERRQLKSGLAPDQEAYITQAKLVVDLVRSSKQQFYHENLAEPIPKEAFHVIKQLTKIDCRKLPLHTDETKLASDFLFSLTIYQ
jgi:hypothetical protein